MIQSLKLQEQSIPSSWLRKVYKKRWIVKLGCWGSENFLGRIICCNSLVLLLQNFLLVFIVNIECLNLPLSTAIVSKRIIFQYYEEQYRKIIKLPFPFHSIPNRCGWHLMPLNALSSSIVARNNSFKIIFKLYKTLSKQIGKANSLNYYQKDSIIVALVNKKTKCL